MSMDCKFQNKKTEDKGFFSAQSEVKDLSIRGSQSQRYGKTEYRQTKGWRQVQQKKESEIDNEFDNEVERPNEEDMIPGKNQQDLQSNNQRSLSQQDSAIRAQYLPHDNQDQEHEQNSRQENRNQQNQKIQPCGQNMNYQRLQKPQNFDTHQRDVHRKHQLPQHMSQPEDGVDQNKVKFFQQQQQKQGQKTTEEKQTHLQKIETAQIDLIKQQANSLDKQQQDKEAQFKESVLKKQENQIVTEKTQQDISKNKNVINQSQIKVQSTKEEQTKDTEINKKDSPILERAEQSRIQERIENQAPNIPAPVIFPSMIVKEAEKERIGSIHNIFQDYIAKHLKYLRNHQSVLRNIVAECERRRKLKLVTSYMIRDYFSHLASIAKDFHSKSYKLTKEEHRPVQSQNLLINMRMELKSGFQELEYTRKAMGNDFLKLNQFLTQTIITNIQKLFENHTKSILQAHKKQEDDHGKYQEIEKQFRRRVSKVNKVYTKGKQGIEQDDDVFVEMARFVKTQKDLRQALAQWGTALVQFRKRYVEVEQTLFQQIQQTFNEYKSYIKTIYTQKDLQPLENIIKMQDQVLQQYKFSRLCVITNCDYICYVFQLNQKGKDKKQLSNKDFESFLTASYFQSYTGDAAQLLKGTTSKTYELKKEHCMLVNTICGNLILFNRTTVQLQQKFAVRNISAKIVSQGVVEISETVKKLIFTSDRTIRVIFKDTDRAEELIMFLNEQTKEEQPIQ